MYVSNTNKITKHHEQGGRDLIGGVYIGGYCTRINSDRALLGGGSMSGTRTRTVPYGREDRRLLHVSFSQDVVPKPIYQLILSEDYNNRIIPFF